MAFYGNVLPASDDEDEDLEALRLAALQTLGSKPPPPPSTSHITNTTQHPVLRPTGPGRGFRGGMTRMHSGRNQIFQRHRQNSNLIAIVPVSNESPPGGDVPKNIKMGRGQIDSGIRLELPQHRYCKVERSKDDKEDTPIVSTKFSRYDDSNSDSSAEESEGEDTSDKISASGAEEDEDRDVLTVAEDSLDKLMDELEEELNRSDTNVPVSNSVKPNPEPQKRTKISVSKSKHNVCDSKSQKSQGGVSTSKSVPVSSNSTKKKSKECYNNIADCKNDLPQSHTVSATCKSVTSYPSNHEKTVLSGKGKNIKSSVPQNSKLSQKTDTNSQKQFSSILNRKSRSRSSSRVRTRSRSRSQHNNVALSKKIRRSRSPSPRGRYDYSPVRSQMRRSRSPVPRSRLSRSPVPRGRLSRSPLPRNRLSRSPVRLARSRSRSRSRSPLRPLRSSPRKRYSRSPPWHSPPNNHLSRFSPQRSPPRPRRVLSPRRSPSPRVSRPSPQRSPQSRWWPSPRRSISPRLRRSPSLPPRHLSPRSRRISPSPRRTLSPIRRRISPSPIRRNPSPLRRFSPRRKPSPSVRYSRSVSRSPDRFVKSPPASRSLRHVSPHSPKRRTSHSPSPRRRLSHSPFNRLPPRHSPVNRKLSPWTPPKQNVSLRISPISRRFSNSPDGRRRSRSPYSRQRRRSASPARRPPINRPPPRSQRSPPRDGRRPPQESRVNNVRPRSRSPLPIRQHPDSNIRRSRSPRHARSPLRRSRSPTSSISLSPSPERDIMNDAHRYKSPLRLHTSDYRNTVPILHTSKENSISNRQRTTPPVQALKEDSVTSVKPAKTKSSKRKEPRNKTQKRERSKEAVKRESDRKFKENTSSERIATAQESSPVRNDNQSENIISDSKLAILEARRRKFESKGPVKPEAKKIRLKVTQVSQQSSPQKTEEKQEEELEIEPAVRDESDFLKEEEEEETTVVTEKSASTLDNSETLDNIDFELDEPILELESGDLWSSEESNSDNEGRFKSSSRIEGPGGKVTVLPFTKLLGESKTSTRVDQTSSKHKKSVSKKNISEEVSKSKKVSSKNKEDLKTINNEKKKATKQLLDDTHERVKVESKISTSAIKDDTEADVEYSPEGNDTVEDELPVRNREGDLRAELSRRRAERLTKAGSLHESLPARLLQSAFEGVVGKKNIKRIDVEEKKTSSKRADTKKEKTDGRRVLVLKRPTVAEQRIPSISVTIPKDNKRDLKASSPPAKLPIRMRLGLPSGGSPPEERLVARRRNRKVKLKRNVMIGSRPDDKV